ncbi:HEPN domain-containing protein [Exiguobacterium acetylicum]|uniref:HEPN domain-containing protein n=1 Tax=Exiguobacterium acetylicum TaxID=41170 RepID=UPI001EE29B16|nr:HEPN domain-containing protein [Exiguobacterium acetylicum]UKS57752.1 hypothetical protein K6T22_16840 [Exiguobacterium acetylicum]
MKFYFLASVHFLGIQTTLNRGINLMEGVRLSNNTEKLDEIIDSYFSNQIGGLEKGALIKNPFFYYHGDLPENHNPLSERDNLELLDYYLKIVQSYNNFLWLEKDNSVDVELGFLYIKDSKNFLNNSVTSNSRSVTFLNAGLERETVIFTLEELRAISDWASNHDYKKLLPIDKQNDETKTLKTNRLDRFNFFLQGTRSQAYLPLRIGMYCTLLEILLSTDNTEVSHKISERLSLLLGETYDEKLKIYSFIKKAYAIRSSVYHGSNLPKKGSDEISLKKTSREFDEYVRRLYLKIISDSEILKLYIDDDITGIEKFFKELLFK